MSDSTSHIDTIATAQAQKEVTANAALNAQAPAADFGRRDTQSANLTFGLYGARGWRVDGVHTPKDNTTVLATASITGYVEVDRSGVQSFSATKTAGKRQSFEVTSGASAVSTWKDLRPIKPFKFRLAKALPDANYTLLADECICDILDFTGTLTAARDVIVPAVPETWDVYNGTTGGFGIVVKTATGSGVTVPAGQRYRMYCDGTNVVALNAQATFAGGTLSSALNEAPIVTLASAATVNIGAAAANTVEITGTTTITAFDTIASGAIRRLKFSGVLVLTHNATSLILPGGANVTTAAGDVAEFVSHGAGNWRCTNYQRADGTALVAALPSSDEPVNAQTGTTYTYVTGDKGKLVTHSNAAAIAGTLPQAGASFPSGWWMDVQNRGAGTLTITPATSTIDGAASLVLTAGRGLRIVSDGTNYYTQSGAGARLDKVNAFSKNQSVTPSALTDGATINVDASLSNNFKVTLGGNRTLANPTNLTDGMVLNVRIKQDATGSRTLSYGTKYKFPGGSAPVLSTAANAVDFMSCYYDATDDTLACVLNKGFA